MGAFHSATFAGHVDIQEDPCPRLLRSVNMIRSRNICCICKIYFRTKTGLDEHMEREHAENTYTCDHCNLLCETWPIFQKHVYILHDDLAFCTYCYRAFSNFSRLVRHWKIHEPFECEICKDTFDILSGLTEHHDALHRNVPSASQELLSSFYVVQRFARPEEYNLRLLHSVNMIRSRNICCICKIHFKTKTHLDEHMERYHPKNTYTCDHCNSRETWSRLKMHVNIFHDKVTFCTYCYKAFSNFSSLIRHWKIHEPFECEICKDTFVTPSDLTKHQAALHRNPFQQKLSSFLRRFTRQEEHN